MNKRDPQIESELSERLRAIDVRAPQELHERIGMLVAERTATRRRPAGWRLQLGGAVALAAIVAGLLIGVLGGGTSSKLTMRETVALTQRPATTSAPSEDPRNGTELAVAVDGVPFPYWDERFGWRSTGSRTDRLDGRQVTTVFYINQEGQRIGYAIVAGKPAPPVKGGVIEWRGGTAYRLQHAWGSEVVSWQRAGHLCVIAGHDVSPSALLALASWQGHETLSA
ncbi:MAG TPA: hypothetical protein VIH71_06095 [Solirubrobacteraceae bacterium]